MCVKTGMMEHLCNVSVGVVTISTAVVKQSSKYTVIAFILKELSKFVLESI